MNGSDSPSVPPLSTVLIDPLLQRAFEEDLGRAGDVTTDFTVPETAQATARAVARQPGRIAGARIAARAFHHIDLGLEVTVHQDDASDCPAMGAILTVRGRARSILTAERVALNLLGHLSGIASQTRAYVEKTQGTKARITCTRKTLPGLRSVQKFAVRCGGGINHRYGLDDGILIKDNHIVAAGGITAAVDAARRHAGHMLRVEVETDTLDQVGEAVRAGADIVLLDNMSPDQLREAVALVAGRAVTEASGGVTLERIPAIAATGVDYISSGALTHSVQVLDIGLDFDPSPS